MNTSSCEIKPLTRQDRKKLRSQYLFAVLFLFVVIAIFSFIYFFVFKAGNLSVIPIIMFFVFIFIFVGVFAFLFWNTYMDLKGGCKKCYTGIVTEKRVDKHTSSSRSYNTRMSAGTRHKSTSRYYYVSVGGKEHSVPFSEYAKVHVNDKVYLESSPKNGTVLAFEVLEKNQSSDSDAKENTQTILFKSKGETQPMQLDEVAYVKKKFYRKIRKLLIYITIYSLLLFILWPGIFIFLIPLIIAFLYSTIKLMIQLYKYAKFNRNGRLKEIATVQVMDKLTMTSNTNSTKYRLKTNVGNVDVSEKLYKRVAVGNSIALHKARGLNILIGMRFNEGSEYFENI